MIKDKGKLMLTVLTIVFVLLVGLFIYGRVDDILRPLYNKNNLDSQIGVLSVDSQYVQMEIVDEGPEFKIYRDRNTDILYLNIKTTLYSSSLSPIYNSDGKPAKYSDFY